MQPRFAGKVALVTGAASGIGAATARRLFAEGARIAACDLDEPRLSELAKEIDASGERVFAARVDVTSLSEVQAFTDAAAERFWRLDVVVNNAGIGAFGRSLELDPAVWLRTFEVDVHSVFYGTRAALPHLLRAGGGAIVNTASISGLGGDYGLAAYNAAKGAVVNYTRAAALEHARAGVRVNAVCPGPVDTPLAGPLIRHPEVSREYARAIPLGRPARADEIAAAIAFLASDDASYVTGAMLAIDGGLTAATGQPDFLTLLGRA